MRIPSETLEKRLDSITSENKSTAVRITTWVTLCLLVFMFVIRQATKYSVVRKTAIDDLCILLATIFAIGLSITTLILASDGLGILEELTNKRANALMKGSYASDFLYILTVCFAKLTLITFFRGIVKLQRNERRVVEGFGIFIVAWTLASLAAVAFQCGLPKPWEMMTLHCYNKGVFWIVYCIIDMTSEVGIIMLSVHLVAYLKVKLLRKIMVVACFIPRILVIGAALARLIYLFPITPHDRPEFNLWIPTICTQIQICLAISTACVPYVNCFFESIEESSRRLTTRSLQGLGNGTGYVRGHKRGKELYSFDSTATLGLKYQRTPDVSPRIPSPAPLSPLTPPRYASPAASETSSRSPSERGLKLHIPPPQPRTTITSDVASPQTASSQAFSPCMSANGLLSPPAFSPTREPTPPPRSHSPRPQLTNEQLSELNSSPGKKYTTPLLNPLNRTVSPVRPTKYSWMPQIEPTPPPVIPRARPLARSPQRVSMHRMEPNTSRTVKFEPPAKPKYPPRVSSRRKPDPPPKFSTGPDPLQRHSTTTVSSHNTSRPQTQSITTASIPSYYMRTPPTTSPPSQALPFPPSSPQRARNHRVLSPQNSSHKNQMSPISPPTPIAHLPFSGDGETSAGSIMRANQPWDIDIVEPMPVVKNVQNRGSPKIILQRYD